MATSAENPTHTHEYTGVVRQERRRRRKTPDGRTILTVQTIEAEVKVTLNLFDIMWHVGESAIQNANGRGRKMRGAVKAKIISEKILDTRTTPQ